MSVTNDFLNRAVAIFGTDANGVRWPYGMSMPSRRPINISVERFQKALDYTQAGQRIIVDWAERYGLRYSPAGCCPIWLLRPTSRRCKPGACRNYGGLDYVWLDHAIGWLKDGRPAVLTSAPATQHDASDYGINEWLTTDDRLRVAFGDGWYGYRTNQIVMWRTDRLPLVEPAVPSSDEADVRRLCGCLWPHPIGAGHCGGRPAS